MLKFKETSIDSDDSIPPAYVAWRVGTKNRVVVPVRHAGNQFLGSLKGLQIQALIRINLQMTSQNVWNMSLFERLFKGLSLYLEARI